LIQSTTIKAFGMINKIVILLAAWVLTNETIYSQTVKGNLYYDLGNYKKKNASGLTIYLIPVIEGNDKIIKGASRYEATCNEESIKRAKGYKITISDKEGNFFLNNISKGKYLVKICSYYGGYYLINIKSNFTGTVSLPRFEADPPVK
jgi:hypothetical protein